MNTNNDIKFFEELDNDDALDAYLQFDAQRPRHLKGRISKKLEAEECAFIDAQDDNKSNIQFTYKASRHEEGWLLDSLVPFYEQRWISDVLRLIKGGKEASVYLCKPGSGLDAEFLVVKVYRPRQFRNLKNDALYRRGRTELDENGHTIVDEKTLHAIDKRTAYGERMRHQSWIAYEYQTLQTLHAADVDVPAVYAMGNNAILMEYVGNAAIAAPTLNTINLNPEEAQSLFKLTVVNIDRMLAHDCIHADLSSYNILYWDGKITLIDFPQVVSPAGNPSAWQIFLRDVTQVCEYFASQGVQAEPRYLAAKLWGTYGHRLIREVHPSHLNPDDPDDRKVWERQR